MKTSWRPLFVKATTAEPTLKENIGDFVYNDPHKACDESAAQRENHSNSPIDALKNTTFSLDSPIEGVQEDNFVDFGFRSDFLSSSSSFIDKPQISTPNATSTKYTKPPFQPMAEGTLSCSPAETPPNGQEILIGVPPPDGFCPECESDYWILSINADSWVCGRCTPISSEQRLETILNPGGSPIPPLQPTWLVCWRDQAWRLRGGHEEPSAGAVTACEWNGQSWQVKLGNGQRIPLRDVSAVAETKDGRIVSAWSVRSHGYDGQG